MKKILLFGLFASTVLMNGCSPEVGSKAWCELLDETPKGDWSMNEATDYAKHCIFRSDEEK